MINTINTILMLLILHYILLYLTPIMKILERKPFLKKIKKLIVYFSIFSTFSLISLTNILYEYSYYKDKNPYYYNWLNPYDLFKFPFDQYAIWKKHQIPTEIKLLDSHQNINYILLIDKTGSTFLPNEYCERSNEIICNIKEEIDNPQTNDPQMETSMQITFDSTKLDLRDYLAMYFLRLIYNSKVNDISFQIILYFGNNTFKSAIPNEIRPNKTNSYFYNVIDHYMNNCKYTPIENQKTDFSEIFQKIANSRISATKENTINNLIIMSDFEHEKSFDAFDNTLKKLTPNLKLDRITLFELKNNRPDTNLSKTTINHITSRFDNSLIYRFGEGNILYNKENLKAFFGYAIATTLEENNTAIYFFKPNNKKYEECSTYLSFDSLDCKDKSLVISLNNYKNYNINQNNLKFIGDNSLLINDPTIINLNDFHNPTEVFLNNPNLSGNKYFITFTKSDDIIATSIPIEIRPKMPFVLVVLLCISYLVALLLLLIDSSIYTYFSIFSLKKKYNAFVYSSINERDSDPDKEKNKLSNSKLALLSLVQILLCSFVLIEIIKHISLLL